ncbi:unnamed protein product, partial [Musa textilis]
SLEILCLQISKSLYSFPSPFYSRFMKGRFMIGYLYIVLNVRFRPVGVAGWVDRVYNPLIFN